LWGWMVFLCFMLIGIIIVTPVQITLFYGRIGENDHLVLEISAWFRLIRRKYEFPILDFNRTEKGPELVYVVEKVTQKKLTSEEVGDLTHKQVEIWYVRYEKWLRRILDLHPVIKQFLKRVRCTQLEWHTAMGTGQADETGAMSGMIWSVKSMLVGVASHTLSFRTIPRMSVQPVWNQTYLRTQLQGSFRLYLGHLLLTGIKVLLRLRRKRMRKWWAAPTEA
jgi:Protein of unknown function (DUF2953)